MRHEPDATHADVPAELIVDRSESARGRKNLAGQGSRARMRRSAAVLISLAVPVGLLVAPVSAQAEINRSDFLKTKEVKSKLHGSAKWRSLFGHQPTAVPTEPARCRVDLPLRRSNEKLRRIYFGSGPSAANAESAVAYTYVYRYSTRKRARKDLRRLTRQTRNCPVLVQDPENGEYITVVRRKLVETSPVGQQSTAWKLREVTEHGTLRWKEKGYAVGARHGRTIVVTTASHSREMPGLQPIPPAKRSVVKLVKAALLKAS